MNVLFANAILQGFGNQACFAIDYDFTTHKCFFFGNNVITTITDGTFDPATNVFPAASVNFFFLNCYASPTGTANARTGTSMNAIANPTTVHITFCESLNILYNEKLHYDYCLIIIIIIEKNNA